MLRNDLVNMKLVLANWLLLSILFICDSKLETNNNEVSLDLELRPPFENRTSNWFEPETNTSDSYTLIKQTPEAEVDPNSSIDLTPPVENSTSDWLEPQNITTYTIVITPDGGIALKVPEIDATDNWNNSYQLIPLNTTDFVEETPPEVNATNDWYEESTTTIPDDQNPPTLDLELRPPAPGQPNDWFTPDSSTKEKLLLSKLKKIDNKKLQSNEISPVDYCKVCPDHTVCQHPKCELSGNCTLVKQNRLTKYEKTLILQHHNELRNKVALGQVEPHPGASNMNQLVWDDELEFIAQCWANQCKFQHDNCRNTVSEQVGQNIVYRGSTSQEFALQETMESLIDDWFDEYKDLPVEFIPSRPYPNPTFTNHYTQVVWAKTERVGCARVHAFEDPFYTVYLYCNYSPRGNGAYEEIYKYGDAASRCGDNGRVPSNDYSGLCA